MANNNQENPASLEAMDDAALATLPSGRVVIRGNNARFLRVWGYHGSRILRFDSQSPGSTDARFEIRPTSNGMVRIWSPYTGTFWRCNAQLDNYVHLNGNNLPEPDTLFQLFKVHIGEHEGYAIRSVHLNLYLKRFTSHNGLQDVFRAFTSNIDSYAIIQVYGVNTLNYPATEEATQEEDKLAQTN